MAVDLIAAPSSAGVVVATPNRPGIGHAVPRAAARPAPPVEEPRRDPVPKIQATTPSDADYLSASRLSQRPAAVGAIDVPYPDMPSNATVAPLVLTLFINERGTVDRIQVENDDAPAAFAEAARSAFALAVFTPGRIDAHAVKSQLRIEVDFGPIDAGR